MDAILEESYATKVNFQRINLPNAILVESILTFVNLVEANMANANPENTGLFRVSLKLATLVEHL